MKEIKTSLNLFQIPVAKHTGIWYNKRRVLQFCKTKAFAFPRAFGAAARLKAIIKMPLPASIFIYVIIE